MKDKKFNIKKLIFIMILVYQLYAITSLTISYFYFMLTKDVELITLNLFLQSLGQYALVLFLLILIFYTITEDL